MGSVSWPDDQVQTLKRMWDEGASAAEIAHAIGRTRNAVLGMKMRLGLGSRAVPPPLNKQAKLAKRRANYQARWARLAEEKAARRLVRLREAEAAEMAKAKAAEERASRLVCEPVSLLEAKRHHCRWIVGSAAESVALFCGGLAVRGSWCAQHAKIGFENPIAGKARKNELEAA